MKFEYEKVKNFGKEQESKFISFEEQYNGKSWLEMLAAHQFLSTKITNLKVDTSPLIYIDIINGRQGYIFFCETNEKNFFVYRVHS